MFQCQMVQLLFRLLFLQPQATSPLTKLPQNLSTTSSIRQLQVRTATLVFVMHIHTFTIFVLYCNVLFLADRPMVTLFHQQTHKAFLWHTEHRTLETGPPGTWLLCPWVTHYFLTSEVFQVPAITTDAASSSMNEKKQQLFPCTQAFSPIITDTVVYINSYWWGQERAHVVTDKDKSRLMCRLNAWGARTNQKQASLSFTAIQQPQAICTTCD